MEGYLIFLKDFPVKVNLPVIIEEDTSFTESIFLHSIEFIDVVKIKGDIFYSDFIISNDAIFKNLQISGGKFNRGVKVKGGKFERLNVVGVPEFKGSFLISGGEFTQINIGLNSPVLFTVEQSQSFLSEKTNIKELIFTGHFHKDSSFFFLDKFSKVLEFNNLVNEGKILFRNINKFYGQNENGNNVFKILNSTLGNTAFTNCDLSEYRLKFESSNISEMSFDGTNFLSFENIEKGKSQKNHKQLELLLFQLKKLYESKGDFLSALYYHEKALLLQLDEIDKNEMEKQKNIYSQLKVMYEQTGNSVNSLEYRAQELNIYRQLLKQTKGKYGEKINLCMNYFSSFYGNYWGQAALITLGVNFIFFFNLLLVFRI